MPQDTRENKIEKFTGKLEKEDSGFTILLNDTLQKICDVDALGLYCYLASKPPQWNIDVKEIGRHFGVGRDKSYKMLNYLVECGAISVRVERDQGRHVETIYLLRIRLSPVELSPLPENPEVELLPCLPDPAFQDTYKTKRKNKTKKGSTAEIAAPPPKCLELFEKHKIKTPAKITNQTLSSLQLAIDHLASNGYTLDDYLVYLSNDCKNWLLPYEIDGRIRRNDFYVIIKKHIIDMAINGQLEDK